MSYQIEKNIPFPDAFDRSKYPFDRMKIGDSFFVPLSHYDGAKKLDVEKASAIQSSLSSTLRYACSKRSINLKKFSSRRVKKDGDILGIRCWRLK